ncbi:hypothetical protein IQ07DRAFT_665126 [Pyrenochaeta sp. DS3sAY3a]|nr:hypothetical protein IQ07DRAFT_665126 [Pyrenochaeta sp. DS3sAY3a]
MCWLSNPFPLALGTRGLEGGIWGFFSGTDGGVRYRGCALRSSRERAETGGSLDKCWCMHVVAHRKSRVANRESQVACPMPSSAYPACLLATLTLACHADPSLRHRCRQQSKPNPHDDVGGWVAHARDISPNSRRPVQNRCGAAAQREPWLGAHALLAGRETVCQLCGRRDIALRRGVLIYRVGNIGLACMDARLHCMDVRSRNAGFGAAFLRSCATPPVLESGARVCGVGARVVVEMGRLRVGMYGVCGVRDSCLGEFGDERLLR